DRLRADLCCGPRPELCPPSPMLHGRGDPRVHDPARTRSETDASAQLVCREALRRSRVVNALLDLGRMEAGHEQLRKEQIDVQSYINRIIKKFNGVAEDNNIDLKLTVETDSHIAIFDSDAIEQVFTNLIDNAFRHTEESG